MEGPVQLAVGAMALDVSERGGQWGGAVRHRKSRFGPKSPDIAGFTAERGGGDGADARNRYQVGTGAAPTGRQLLLEVGSRGVNSRPAVPPRASQLCVSMLFIGRNAALANADVSVRTRWSAITTKS